MQKYPCLSWTLDIRLSSRTQSQYFLATKRRHKYGIFDYTKIPMSGVWALEIQWSPRAQFRYFLAIKSRYKYGSLDYTKIPMSIVDS